jgi:glycerol kinase
MQLQADLLGRPVHVAATPEASALGVAALAARAIGLTVAPHAPAATVPPAGTDRSARRTTWARAVARARWAPEDTTD